MIPSEKIRLNKAIARAGIAARRKADELIAQGRVKVNGKLIKLLGTKVDISKDAIEVSGKKLDFFKKDKHYFLLNKPAGHITSIHDPHNKKNVMQLVPMINGLFPVGRLDKNTTGLLLITNDGELAHRLTHPKFNMPKVYNAEVDGKLIDMDLKRLEKGIFLDGEKTAPCKVKTIVGAASRQRTQIQITLHQGRKRQIRRMLGKLGYNVLKLDRMEYAGIKKDIKLGGYRKLKESEIKSLYRKVGLR